jgi:hypothetical protein
LIDKLVELILHVLHQAPPVLGKYGMMAARSALTYVCPLTPTLARAEPQHEPSQPLT